ncbi:ubiquitin carboxyl-terminal hydrolase 10 isoform X2 [Petromyzon marinus]|uniref:ubiquitin carboxyl-terminal hydrolase 10 isoform X2 n=1 Tax=Petromyzon marinus TaxID=7757 RepID=UPI003F7265AA
MESGAKYIFGEFSHEEVQQYFQNSHISVELPPCSEDTDDDDATGRTGGGDCSEPARGLASSNGGDNSVEGSPPDEVGGPSTLNPRAPEFCLPLEQPATSFPRQPAPPPFPPAPMVGCRTTAAAAVIAAPLVGDPAPLPPNSSVHTAALSMGPAAPLTFGHPVPTAALQLPLFVPPQSALAGAEAAPVVVPRPLVPVHALPVGLAPTASATAFFGSAHTAPVVLLQPLPAFNNGDEMSAAEAAADGNGDGSSRSSGGPRERRNKKKRPPGYYGYQDGTGAVNGMSCADDGDEASPDAPFAPPPPQGAAPPHQGRLPSPVPPSQDPQPQPRQPPEASVPAPRPAEPAEQPAPPCKQPAPVLAVPPAAVPPPVPSAPPAPPQSAAQPTELPGIGGPQGQQPPVMMMMLMNGPQGLPVEALLVNQLGMPAVPGVPVVASTAPMTVPLLVLPQRMPPVVMSVAPQAAVQLVAPVLQAPAAQPPQPTVCPQQKPQQPQPKQQPQPTQQSQQVGNSTTGSSSSSSLIMLATRGAHQLPVSAIRTGGSFKFGGDTNFADVSGRQRESPPVVFTNACTVPRAALLRDGAAVAPMAPPVGDLRSSSAPGDAAKQPRPMATIAPISFGPAMPALSEVVTLPPAVADRQRRASAVTGSASAPARSREEQVAPVAPVAPVAAVAPTAPRCGEARKGSAQLNGVETAPARPGVNTNAAVAPAGSAAATAGRGGRPATSMPAAAFLDPRPQTPTLAHGSSCPIEASAVGRDAPAAVAPAKDAQAGAVGREAPAIPAGRPAPAAAVTAAGREPSAGAESREAPAVAAAAVAGKSAAAGDAAAHDARPQPPALPGVKTWASLFSASKPAAPSPGAGTTVRVDLPAGDCKAGGERSPGSQEAPVPQTAPAHKAGPVSVAEDPCATRIAELLSLTPLSYKPVSVQPRGLINRGNWCYINSTLQVLVACVPLYHLLRALPLYGDGERPVSATPMLDAFIRLMKEYGSMLPPSKPKTAGPPEKSKDLRVGSPFEPAFIYKLLSIVKSSLCDKGRQEDAEEFLGFVINGLHDEMLSLRRLDSADGAATNGVASDGASSDGWPEGDAEAGSGGPRGAHGNGRGLQLEDSDGHGQRANNEKGGEEEEEEEEWEQVGPRNRSAITRSAEFVRSPITDIFGGCIRSAVYQAGVKESATLQPFFTLPLDVSAERVWTLRDALEGLVAREAVQGYTTKNRQEVEVCRRITLEELPPVLVLHLKRFVYDKTGGSQKLLKAIDYPLELEISKDLLSPIAKVKLSKGQRSYRLFAVTCHHGGTAAGGHYTTDVQHAGLGLWLHYDDQGVRPTALSAVLKPVLPRTAYLLYYRRADVQ